MTTSMLRALMLVTTAALLVAQGARAQDEPRRPLSVQVGGFYDQLDNGYSDWRGLDVRVMYSGSRASPFASASSQSRREGQQASYGLGSYVTLGKYLYAIGGFSVATGGTAVFYPRLRWDVSLMTDTRVVPGLVIATGFTHVSFGGGSTGTITSLGPIWYHGPLILSGSAHLNHDGVGGATTGSAEAGGQYGAEGKYWVGGSLNAGHEAYQILSAAPFDVQFTNVGGSLFYDRWLTRRTDLRLGLDYQDKRSAYHRRGVQLAYRVAF